MVLDTSALFAILADEPERRALNLAIQEADSRLLSAAGFVEISIVIETRFGAEGMRELDLFLDRAGIELVDVTSEQARIARHAFSRYGKGRHRASLDYGDCFSYALAASLSQPLLYKGEDFSKTDIAAYVPST